MDTEIPKKSWWLKNFENAVKDSHLQSYDWRGLTEVKRERELTSLLTVHLLTISKEDIVVNEVNHHALSRSVSPLQDGERADLMIMERKQRIVQWERPKLYAEFKFWYNYDLEPKVDDSIGEFQNPRNYLDNLEDLHRLYEFKKFSPETTCVQGFFFCYNRYARGAYESQGSGIPFFQIFLDTYCDSKRREELHNKMRERVQKSSDENIRQRRILFNETPAKKLSGANNLIALATPEEKDFWLYLALIEVDV